MTVGPSFHALTCGKVHKLMGLKDSRVPDQGADTFSDDVLKIEICGPKQQHLSVIDVPGIFRNTTEGVTTDSDIEIVRNMVNHYMKNPRSVILAVIPANVDIATQEILKMAQKCDAKGERTLGVLTKPDLVDRGAENRVVDLVEGISPAIDPCRQEIQNTDIQQAEATNSSSAGRWSGILGNRNWKTLRLTGMPQRKTSSRARNLGPDSRRTVLVFTPFSVSSATY